MTTTFDLSLSSLSLGRALLSRCSRFTGLARPALLGALSLIAVVSGGCPLQTPVNDQTLTAITLSGVTPNENVQLGAAGQNFTFTAGPVVKDGAAFDGTIEWTSSNPGVVTLTTAGNGLAVTLTAVANGTSTITGRGGGVSVQFTVTVNIVVAISSLVVAGPDTLALGDTGTYTVTAKDASGNTVSSASANWSFPGSSDLFEFTGASTGASVEVKAIGVGAGGVIQAAQQGFSGVVSQTVHATGFSVTVAVAPAAGPYLVGNVVSLSATAHGAGSVTGSAARTEWSRTSGACVVNSAVGAGTTVTPTGGGDCVVTATLDTTLTAVTTFLIIAPTSILLSGPGGLEPGGTGTYTAVVKDSNGNPIQGASVTFTGGAGTHGDVFTIEATGGTATLTGVLIGSAAITATSGTLHTSLGVTVVPASIEWTQPTLSMLPASTGQVFLRAKNAAGAAVGFGSVPSIGKSSSDLVVTFAPVGPSVSAPGIMGDGTLSLALTTLAMPLTGSFSGSATLYDKTTATPLALTVTGPTSVTLTTSTDTAPVGSFVSLTPAAMLADSAISGVAYSIANSGDAILSPPAPLTGQTPEGIGLSISGLGKASLIATVLGVSSTAHVLYGVPAALALMQGSTVITAASPGAAQLGQTPTQVSVMVKNESNGNVTWNQATLAHGTLTLTSSAEGVATVGTCTNPFNSSLLCPITPVSTGTTTLTATWTSQDGVKTAAGTAALTVTGAAAPAWPASPTFAATWTGPKQYGLSFLPATSTDGTITYTVYASSAADAATSDGVLFAPGNVQMATIAGTSPLTTTITLAAFSSRMVIGVRAKTANSGDSVGQRFTIGATAAAGYPGAIAFVAGRTVFEADVTTQAVKPLYVLGAASATGTQLERTAPRWSKTASAHGYVGVTVNSQAQGLYGRAVSETTLSVTPDMVSVQTDGHSCSASPLSRPTTAFDALLNGTLTRMFTNTLSPVVSCGRASVVTTVGGGQQVLLHDVEQVVQQGDSGLVSIDNGWLRVADLGGASVAEHFISTSQLTGATAIAAWPGPGQSAAAGITFVYFGGTDELSFYDQATLPTTPQSACTSWLALADRRLERMVAVSATKLVLETSLQGTDRKLLLADTSACAAPTVIGTAAGTPVDNTLTGDEPTLGSTTAAGH